MARRGRPEFKPTDEMRAKVEECIGCGMTHEDIARAIGCCDKTLEKHFADELQYGRARKRSEALELIWASARKGNVSAQKKLVDMTGTLAAHAAWDDAESRQPAPLKLGKKEQQAIAAATAGIGSEWGDDLIPGGSKPH